MFEQFWRNLCKKNPTLQEDGKMIKISPDNFRRVLEQAYNEGLRENGNNLFETLFK